MLIATVRRLVEYVFKTIIVVNIILILTFVLWKFVELVNTKDDTYMYDSSTYSKVSVLYLDDEEESTFISGYVSTRDASELRNLDNRHVVLIYNPCHYGQYTMIRTDHIIDADVGPDSW